MTVWELAHLGSLAMVLFAAGGLGAWCLRGQAFHSRFERGVFSVATGLGLWALIFFVLGLCGLLYPLLIVSVTVVAAAVTVALLLVRTDWRRAFFAWRALSWAPLAAHLAIGTVVLAYVSVVFRSAEFPPINWDSVAYHLVLAREYLRQHQIVAYQGVAVPVLPALSHMLFSWGLAISDDILAQMIECSLMLLAACGLYAWGRRSGRPGLGVAAALFWLGQPLVLWIGASAYVDVGAAAYVFLGLYALRVFWLEDDHRWWYLAMALLAMAAAVKLPAMVLLALAAVLGVGRLLGRPRRSAAPVAGSRWRSAWIGLAVASAIVVPFYGYVFAITRDPFWPSLPALSVEPWRSAGEGFWQVWGGVGRPKTLASFLTLPFQLVAYPQPFFPDNKRELFALVALWPLAWVVALLNRNVRWWTFWALAHTALWFFTTQQLRLWITALPMAALALCESIGWLLDRYPRPVLWRTAAWIGIGAMAMFTGWEVLDRELTTKGRVPPKTASARREHLTAFMPGYRTAEFINQHAGPGDFVYVLGASWLNYHLEPRVIDGNALLHRHSRPSFRWPQDRAWLDRLGAFGVNWMLIGVNDVPAVPGGEGRRDLAANPVWPGYAVAYSDQTMWVLRREPRAQGGYRAVVVPRWPW